MAPLLILLLAAVLDDSRLVGAEFKHVVQRGESLTQVGARYGISVKYLATLNNLKPDARLDVGQELRVENRHIVPVSSADGIVINIPQRMLFLFSEGRLTASYPVGLGSAGWPTVLGDLEIERKEENPTWDVPPSIQEEMRRKGLPVQTKVPPSPENPLGQYYLALSAPGFGIHGTNKPASIYAFQTHGCIRLHADDIADLFPRVSVGAPVHIIYEPVLIAQSGGTLFVEVHPDIYRRAADPIYVLTELLFPIRSMIVWAEVVQTAIDREGRAKPLTVLGRALPNWHVPTPTRECEQ